MGAKSSAWGGNSNARYFDPHFLRNLKSSVQSKFKSYLSETIQPRADMVGSVIPDELIFEILLALPVKPLIRFKCVCKSWNSLISNPQFTKLHLHRSSAADFAHLRLLFSCNIDDYGRTYASSCSVSSFIQNPCPNLASINSRYKLKNDTNVFDRVFGSCNGLISILSFVNEELYIHIWNPATRSISQNSPPLHLKRWVCKFSNFGFGYDYLTHTYKVLMFCFRQYTKVYCFSDNSWRNIQRFPSLVDVQQGEQDGVYLSGTLNWLAYVNLYVELDDYDTRHRYHIVSLDLGKETYTNLSLPYPPHQVFSSVQLLAVLRDCLCVSHDYQGTHFVVWQMNEFGVAKSWTQLVKVSYEYLHTTGYPEFHLGMIVVCMSENEDILMLSCYDESQAILYNPRDNRLQRILIPNNISCGTKGMRGGNHTLMLNHVGFFRSL